MYKLLRNILFWYDAEKVHYYSMNILHLVCKIGIIRNLIALRYKINNKNSIEVFGLLYKNPVGLAAGFDKNARYLKELTTLGFGFIEIGTVTPLPQKGNVKPRLFRLPKDKALINRMGFNNDGVLKIAKRLRKWKKQQPATGNSQSEIIIGGNIGKNKYTPNKEAWKDYEICFRELFDCVDYFVVNVSSPNTPGLIELQQKDSLEIILSHLQRINLQNDRPKPILVKISPDLYQEELDDVIDLCLELNISGIVACNTTSSRDMLDTSKKEIDRIGPGGLSGKPLLETTARIVSYICSKTNNKLPVIASGGIFNEEDAKEKLSSGASLIQVWTGFIYEGPSIVKDINKSLAAFI
jgi:dihydroorotate dehydrogenase